VREVDHGDGTMDPVGPSAWGRATAQDRDRPGARTTRWPVPADFPSPLASADPGLRSASAASSPAPPVTYPAARSCPCAGFALYARRGGQFQLEGDVPAVAIRHREGRVMTARTIRPAPQCVPTLPRQVDLTAFVEHLDRRPGRRPRRRAEPARPQSPDRRAGPRPVHPHRPRRAVVTAPSAPAGPPARRAAAILAAPEALPTRCAACSTLPRSRRSTRQPLPRLLPAQTTCEEARRPGLGRPGPPTGRPVPPAWYEMFVCSGGSGIRSMAVTPC
jgi:hypothetical protein